MKTPTRILIVEDMAADVDLAKHAIGKVLETCEFEVVETRGDFLKSLETFQPDLILSDYSLPHFDGMKALKLALKQAPFTPLIIWTGSISEDVAVDCMKAGANNYVLKENLKRLGPAVVHALEERELLVERHQAEEKLKERERQLTFLFGNLPGPVYRCRNDANYTVEFISDGITELSGYPAADFHQDRRHFGRMIHPADQERVWAEIQTAVAESQPFELTYRILTATGEEKWVWEKGLGVRDTEGHLQGLEGFITDVTRRKQAEKIVAESEQRYRAVTELVSDYAYSYRVAPEGTLQQEWVTDAYHRITGYDPTELRGEGAWRKLIHPDDLALASEHVRKIFAGRQNVAEYRIVTKSGQVRYLRDFARPLWDEKENRIVRMIGAAQDITERKQAEEALQNSEKRFRALIEHGLDSISLLAPDGTLIWESPATFRTLDYLQNEYVGHNIFELMHPDDLEWTRDLFIKLVQEPGNSQRAIFRLRHSNGTWRWVEAVGTNMLNEPSVQAIVINYRDITERKQAGETLQYALEETKRSELLLFKLSEVSQVIQRAHSAEEVYHAIGEGLSSLGYRVTILAPTEGRQHFTVAHTTVSSKILNALEKITGFSFLTYRFPLVEGGFLKEVIDKGEATLSVLNEAEVAKILPGPLRLLAPTVLQLVDTHDVISVPIAARDESYSLFLVDAHQLTEADVPPITAFAAQASIALENAQLYESIQQELYERKRAEEKLSLSDQILQRVNALVLVSDSQGSIVYVSPAARLILGYEPDELLGDNWWRLSRAEPGEAQNEREYVEGAARGETPIVSEAYERPIRDRWGNIRWISWVDAAGPGDLLIGVGHDVTERKQAESRINDLLAFNEKILNHSSIGILTYKLTGECVFANENAASMIGSQVEQLRTQNFRTIAAWKKSGLYDLAEKAITTQAAVTADLHHISTFGKDIWITAHCVTFKWKEEDHLLLSISDISERKRAEEALRESENRLILALSGAQMSVWEWNLQTNRILWSPEFFEITGVTEDNFGGTFESFTNLIHPQDVARVRASAEKALADKALFAEEFRIIRPDGEIRWLSNLGHAEYDPTGSYLRLIGTVQDVTQRKRAEEALRQSENRYRTLVETQTEFIVRWKSDGIRTFANEAYCRYFGLTPEQAISGKFMPLVYEQDRQDVEEKLQRLLAGVTNVETETHRVIKPDGSIGWQEWTDQAIYDNDGKLVEFQSVGRDVTARKQAEIERQALLEIAQGFANTKDLQELLKLIHRSVAKVIYAENFFVVRYQPNRDLFEEIYSVDQYDLPEPPAKLEKSITSYVFRSGEPLLLTQVLFDELVKQGELKLIGTNSASWLGVPLKTSDRTIGVMAVQDYENDNRYTERDRDFLTSIATQVALAIEHREAGIALRESEEHYRAIFEGVQDAIFVESTDGKILTVNERACEMFGYSHSEFLAKTVTDLVPKGYPILTVDGLTATVSPEPRETVNQRANGEIFPIEISGRVQVINGESVLLAVVSDITKRKRAEERLRESEERFSSAFEYASIGVALLTPAGHWLRVNRALCDLTGYSEAELLEKNFQDLTHPDDLESDLDHVRQLLAGQINSYQMEKRYFHKLGHVLWVLLSVSLVRGDQGEPLYFISQIQDITERKQAEAALLESINQFRTLFEASPDAIMLLDPSGNWPILDCNTAACEMNGYARDELIGQSVDILNAIPSVASERTAYLERIRQANILRYETLHRHKNGTMFPIEVSTSLISLNGRDVILGIDRDITERKQAENSLKAEREKAQKYLDIAGVMMLALDPNGTVTLINQKGCEILGYPVDEIIGKDWIRTFLPEAERGELQKVFQQLTRDKMESVGYYENNILTKNGEKRLIAWHNTVVRDAEGTIINTLSSGEDITARKQAEAELRASEERFRQLADNIQEVFWMTDAESGKELYISPAAEAIWGRSVESLMSDPSSFANSIFPEDQPAVMHAIERERSGERVEIEYRIVQPNGSLRWVWDRGFPIFDESGRAKRIAGISADITERREAELALVQSQSRYRELFDSSPISIWEEDFSAVKKRLDSLQKIGLADLKEYLFNHPEEIVELASLVRITDVNNAALELYGVEQKEVLLKGLTQILSKDTLKHFQDEILGFMSPSKKFIWEGTDHNRDGKPMEVVVTGSIPYGYEEDWSKVIVSVSDITERKRAEAEIRRRAKETSALLETSLALTNLDLKATLQTVSNSARALFAADGCRIFLMEPDGESLRCVLALQENPTAFSNLRIRIGEGVTGAVAASGQAEIVNQMQNDPRGVQVPGTQEQEEEAIMFAPLKERDHTIGVLSIRRAGAERPFQAADLELLEAFASMAASAVSNARLFGETQRRLAELEALYENGLAVGRLLKRSEIGERVIKTFARHLAWHHVTIRLRREESDELELVAFNLPHLQNEERTLTEQRFTAHISKVGQGLSGWVIQTGLPFRTGNVHAHPQYIVTHAEIRSGLYMPLKVGERVLGVISVESELPDAFTEQDERLLATLAGQAAIAFENARLYEAIEQELSDRKRAEEALHASETHYRELADSITDILFELDQNLHYTHWNKASEALTGIPTEAAIGKSMYENEIFGDAEGQTSIRQIYEDVFKNRRPRTFERTMLLNRERRSFEINAYPSTRGVSVVAKDVTDRKKSEIIMQKRFELMEYSAHHTLSELMQRAVDEISELTGSAMGFLHFVEPDEVTLGMQTWSTNALRLFDVPDIPVSVTAHLPLDQAGVWAEAARQRHSLIQNNYESLSKKKGLPQGHVPILREMVVPIIRNERIVAVMGIGNKPQDYTQNDLELAERLADYAWDITERKQMQVALEAERNQLARRVDERTADLSRANSNLARALRVKDEFLANMSHELRTPLNAILGLSESLSEQTAGPLNEKQQKYIATISESGHHLLALINDILDLAKIDAGQITLDINKVDIHSVCQASLRMIKQLAQKKNQEVTLQIDDGLGLMWADERRLKQMIVNLLGNAVKFTPENGKLGLEVHGDQEANKVTITVWDNGIGIREGDLARLFQPFVQLDSGLARETTGTGLGLALVAQMARLHGGSVQASSAPEKGSRFSIVLPWEPALAMDSSSRLRITGKFRAIRPNETNQPTILLVEDTKEIVMMLKDYLELAGYKVVTAQDGVDAIVQAKLVRPDLILMDIQMPRMDGLETTHKLRSDPDFKFTPIIALTALAMPNDRERCLAAGMDEYISKPVNLKALVKIIQSCLFNEESKSR